MRLSNYLRQRYFFWAICILGILSLITYKMATSGKPPPPAQPMLGVNLSGPCDWNTEFPFVDVFRISRPWISQRTGLAFGKGPELNLDKSGWVTRLEPGCWVETPLCNVKEGHYPSGTYTVLYDGNGNLDFWGSAQIESTEAGRVKIKVDANKGVFFFRIMNTDPDNYVRNIRVIMPGFEDIYRDNPFHPKFLRNWQGLACFRFMDWMITNNSEISHWAQRPTPEDATFSAKGVALEYMIDLCNRTSVNPWFCMPHMADDEYILSFARMVKERLDPKLKVYIEYSNEVWNNQFEQHRYSARQGNMMGFSDNDYTASLEFNSYRSVQIFAIWESVFGGTDRLVRVLASQSVSSYASKTIIRFHNAWKHADALAIAPYFGFIPNSPGEPSANQVQEWNVEQALGYMEKTPLVNVVKCITEQKKIADKFGLKLIAYEGGQHMVGQDQYIIQLFYDANGNERMGTIYGKYLDAWTNAGGDLFCHFSSVAQWSQYGYWGLMQYYDENPAKCPKFMAVLQWADRCGQTVTLQFPE